MFKNIPTHQHVASILLDQISAVASKSQIIMSPEAGRIVIDELEKALQEVRFDSEAQADFYKAAIALIKEEMEV